MKKIFSMFIILFLCLFIIDVIYQASSTQIVLLSGRIMGFEIEDYKENSQSEGFVPTSANKLGTVTFIKKGTHEFAALGHPAIENSSSEIRGMCHEITIDSIDKSYKNHIGHIYGTLSSDKQMGNVSENNEYGIFGTINEVKESNYIEIQTASKYEIKLGEAELLISLENEEIQTYKIKIVAINYFSNNKNIKIKIEDNNLIAKTGGVVQGMSGAPIVQNGKLVGAINFANPEKPEEAYAIFINKLT